MKKKGESKKNFKGYNNMKAIEKRVVDSDIDQPSTEQRKNELLRLIQEK